MEATTHFSARDLAYTAVFAALLAICSWISIPTTVPFTMQTFGIFLTMGLLGGKRGTAAVLVFILMAALGIPVLAGFTGGLGILFGPTGGYILGFLLTALLIWGMEHFFGKSLKLLALGMVLGLLVCYLFSTIWYVITYSAANGPVGIMTALGWCVLPYIIPDLVKIGLALLLTARLRPYVR